MTPSTDQQEKVGADIKAARTVLVGLYGSTFIDEPRRPRLTAAENKALGDLLADHAALTFDSVNLRDEVGEWKANANKAEGVIAAQAEEIERLRSSLKFQTVKADEAERQRAVIIREMPILLRTWCKARFKKWIKWQTATNFRAEVLQTALTQPPTGSAALEGQR